MYKILASVFVVHATALKLSHNKEEVLVGVDGRIYDNAVIPEPADAVIPEPADAVIPEPAAVIQSNDDPAAQAAGNLDTFQVYKKRKWSLNKALESYSTRCVPEGYALIFTSYTNMLIFLPQTLATVFVCILRYVNSDENKAWLASLKEQCYDDITKPLELYRTCILATTKQK